MDTDKIFKWSSVILVVLGIVIILFGVLGYYLSEGEPTIEYWGGRNSVIVITYNLDLKDFEKINWSEIEQHGYKVKLDNSSKYNVDAIWSNFSENKDFVISTSLVDTEHNRMALYSRFYPNRTLGSDEWHNLGQRMAAQTSDFANVAKIHITPEDGVFGRDFFRAFFGSFGCILLFMGLGIYCVQFLRRDKRKKR